MISPLLRAAPKRAPISAARRSVSASASTRSKNDSSADEGCSDASLSPEARALGGRVAFTALADSTAPEIELMSNLYRRATTAQKLAGRACDLLRLQQGVHTELGAQVDLYEHALQSATRAHRDGASDEVVACALLHDVGEVLCPSNHGDVAAAILRPYISKEAHWVLAHHEVFQVSACALGNLLAGHISCTPAAPPPPLLLPC